MGSGTNEERFSAPPVRVTFDGILFDMDGTIIDSTAAVVKHWHTVGKEIGVDPELILQTSHGRRSIDTLKVLAPEKATWEYTREMEALLPQRYGQDAVEIPGARALLDAVIAASVPWAVVTSGTVPLVTGWMTVLSLPRPATLITAEDVAEGKPDPACYLLGRERLGLAAGVGSGSGSGSGDVGMQRGGGSGKGSSSRVLVLEDSPAGIRAGKAAGCEVVGLVTSHTVEQVVAAEPDWVVRDLDSVRFVESKNGAVTLEIRDALAIQ